MSQLTLCMPSNRSLSEARPAIESALAFAAARGALLVVADNSGDAEKRAFLAGLAPQLTLVGSASADAVGNMLEAVRAATTPFVLLVGDDDLLVAEEDREPIDLADLPFDYVGVMPIIETFLDPAEAGPCRSLLLDQEEASDRLLAYLQSAPANNGAFYSIFRREIWLSTMELFHRFHPTRGAYGDWALFMALLSCGKMGQDSSIRYRYQIGRWATDDSIVAARRDLFRAAGLGEAAVIYEPLFMFLDVFVLANRVGSPLSIDERQRFGKFAVNYLLGNFIRLVADQPGAFDASIPSLAEMVLEETDSFGQFQIALLMAERVQPGLKDKYVTFIQAAVQGGWS